MTMTTRLEKLTPDQEQRLLTARAEWLAHGLSTTPSDRPVAEAAITEMYHLIGKPAPAFVWVDSPAAAMLARWLLGDGLKNVKAQLWDQLGAQLWAQLWAQLRAQLWAQLRDQLGAQLRDQLWDQLRDQLGDQLRAQLGDQLGAQLWDQLGDQLRDQLGAQLGDQLGAQLGDQLGAQLRDQLRAQLRDQLRAQLGAQLRDQLWDQLGDQLGAQLGDQLGAQLWDQLGDQLRAQLGDQLRAQLGDQLGDQLWDQLGDQLWAQLRAQLWAQLRAQLRAQLGDQLGDQLGAQLGDQLGAQLWDQLWDQLRDQLGDLSAEVWHSFWPAFETYWIAYYTIPRDLGIVTYPAEASRRLDLWGDLARSLGAFWPYERAVICCERPSAIEQERFGELGRIHAETGAAVAYRDGWAMHVWHGRRVPAWVVENPTVEQIAKETNAETRRCAIESMGWPRFIAAAELAEIDRCPDPGNPGHEIALYDVPRRLWGDEVRVVIATNGTVERDGTRRVFGLTAPAWCRTALEAVAWMYDVPTGEYAQLEVRR